MAQSSSIFSFSSERSSRTEPAAKTVKLQPALEAQEACGEAGGEAAATLLRIASFCGLVAVLIWSLDAAITAGLKSIPTSIYGVMNRVVAGRVNAQIVITGSSRAASHYDPRIIQAATGYTTFNLGRNGSQTDLQLAILKTYLSHNKKPEIVVHNLDAFTFQTTHEVYNPAQYGPYLNEDELYRPLQKINTAIWKSRYLPLYGYVVEDMSFAWIVGLRALLPWPQRETLIAGFDPRVNKWSEDFERFRAENREGVHWEIEPAGLVLMEELSRLCHDSGIRLVLVYSPEYSQMQKLTSNRKEIFEAFRKVASRWQVPVWDYSSWRHAQDTGYFTNSQHLNAAGADVFSRDVAMELNRYIEGRAISDSVMRRDETPTSPSQITAGVKR